MLRLWLLLLQWRCLGVWGGLTLLPVAWRLLGLRCGSSLLLLLGSLLLWLLLRCLLLGRLPRPGTLRVSGLTLRALLTLRAGTLLLLLGLLLLLWRGVGRLARLGL